MIIYNVTTKVTHDVARQYQDWLTNEHMDAMVATGCFTEYRLAKLLGHEEEEGITYVIQYMAPDMEDYERYIEEHATEMRKSGLEKFGHKMVAFRSLMEVI